MDEHEYEIVEAMARYGGSFVTCLAECFHHADIYNFRKLKDAFPEIWEEYEKILQS